MPQITPEYLDVSSLSADALIRTELPYVSALYNSEESLHADVAEWVGFFIEHHRRLPMYGMTAACAEDAQRSLERYYRMLEDALAHLFRCSDETILQWFDCSATKAPGFRDFLAFARTTHAERATWHDRGQPVYGRLDAAVDPMSGQVKAVYEFNGDTPVMLFESVNLQNLIVNSLGQPGAQSNQWWAKSQEKYRWLRDKAVACVCDVDFIEDSSTTETVAQMFEAVGARVYFTSLKGLNHDLLCLEKPFEVDGVTERPDAIFMLLAWEEMVLTGQNILQHWRRWYRNVQFFEPPWRWFMSSKSMMAFVTHLMDTDPLFRGKWAGVPHLRTMLSADYFIERGQDYVSKPTIGRLSQNITIVRNGEVFDASEGVYQDETRVYQTYHAPYQVEGRNNFIMGGWLAGDEVETLCFREFDHAVLDLVNERFVAHIIK